MSYREFHWTPRGHCDGDYRDPAIPDNRVDDAERRDLRDLHGPRRCLVGNIKHEKPKNSDWRGPRNFRRGQKIYLILGKDERLVVLGRHRGKNAWINTWLNASHTENWRIQTIYKRVVLLNTSDAYYRNTTLEEVRDSLNDAERFPLP